MKRKIITIIMALCLLVTPNAEARGKFWQALGKGLKNVAAAAGSAMLYESCLASGYTEEQSSQMIKDTYNALGLNTKNADLGISYMEADNKYERQNLVKDIAFDVASEATDNPSMVEKFRTMTDAQLTYLGDMQKATSDEEKSAIFNNRTKAYADLLYDTYQEAKKRKAAHLANQLQIKEQLMEQGYTDDNLAFEVAGSIIAVQESDIPEEEKKAIIKGYGLNENIEKIQQISTEIIAMDDDALTQSIAAQEEEKRQALLREKEEQERLERERQAKLLEEKNNDIKKVSNLVLSVFAFDETNLTESQKTELNEVVNILKKYDDLNLTIIGHTCKIGYKNINLKKGLKRAESAKAYLVENGISENRITVDSKGETEPISKVNSKNRRIELIIE